MPHSLTHAVSFSLLLSLSVGIGSLLSPAYLSGNSVGVREGRQEFVSSNVIRFNKMVDQCAKTIFRLLTSRLSVLVLTSLLLFDLMHTDFDYKNLPIFLVKIQQTE